MSATDEIFSAITKQLEEGVVPWHKPWVARPSMIINHYNGSPYKGLRSYAGNPDFVTTSGTDYRLRCPRRSGRLYKGAVK